MNRLMLINGRHVEELRVAVIEDDKLESFRVKAGDEAVERGNIYRGVVANVEGSLDAAFVDYGADKHGFLTRHDVITEAQHKPGKGRSKIDEILERGKPITVQVTRDAVDNKGAMLTTNISLAGRFLVLMPFDDSRGISRKVEDEATRRKLRDKVKGLIADDGNGYGFIVRTNAMEQDVAELKRDLDHLSNLWKRVQEQGSKGSGPLLINDDQDLVVQALRDYLDGEIDEVVIDDEALLERAREYLDATMPDSPIRLTLYEERIPLFSRYNLESQITAIQQRTVSLPSGGSLVIDPTEALTAIDVNSGKATSGTSQGETAFNTNLEAADEVARQIRLRDIGGLFVVDFIDMRATKHQRKVELTLKEALKQDKARTRVGRISDNGLLEINRQRIGQALRLRTHELCPTCKGVGRVNSPILAGLNLLRRIEARAATGRLREVRIELHPQLADRIQNTRRQELAAIESTYRVEIAVIGTPGLELSEERVTWSNYDSPRWPKGKPPQQQSRSEGKAAQHGRGNGRSSQQSRGDGRSSQQSHGDGQEENSKRGRRSRGRRRRGKLSTEAAPEALQQGEQAQQLSTVPESSGPQSSEALLAPAAESEVRVGEAEQAPVSDRPEQSTERSSSPEEAPGEASSRRRRRRRRRRPTQDQPPQGTQESQQEIAAVPSAGDDGAARSSESERPPRQARAERTRPGRSRPQTDRSPSEASPRGESAVESARGSAPKAGSPPSASSAPPQPATTPPGEAPAPAERRKLVILPLLPESGGRDKAQGARAERPREERAARPEAARAERQQSAPGGSAPHEAGTPTVKEAPAAKAAPDQESPDKAASKKTPMKKAPAKKAAKKAPAKKAAKKAAPKKAPAKKAAPKKAPAKKAAPKKAPAKKAVPKKAAKKAAPKKKAASAKKAET